MWRGEAEPQGLEGLKQERHFVHLTRPNHPWNTTSYTSAIGSTHTQTMASSSTSITMVPPPNPRPNSARTLTQKTEQEQASHSVMESDEHDRFFWTYTEEPHRTRRQAIIKAHPEVLRLCGPEPLTIPLVLAVVGLQMACAYLLRDTPMLSWKFLVTGYVIGATANQNLFLAIHEISHNLAFKSPLANRLFAVVANLPIGIPYSASFRVCWLYYSHYTHMQD